jgi:nicotinate-nucleotide adenylyltransferase
MRIGIFGGTFNPIHNGHLMVAQSVFENGHLDRLLLMPCHCSPFKQGQKILARTEDRVAMLERAIAGDPQFEISRIELDRGGVSYAVDTLLQLKTLYPGATLVFVMGMDSLRELHLWHRPEELLTLCEVVAVQRPGIDLPLTPLDLGFPEAESRRLLENVIQGRLCDISSSEIRRRVAEGRSIRYLVPPAVEEYIKEKRLYGEEYGIKFRTDCN